MMGGASKAVNPISNAMASTSVRADSVSRRNVFAMSNAPLMNVARAVDVSMMEEAVEAVEAVGVKEMTAKMILDARGL